MQGRQGSHPGPPPTRWQPCLPCCCCWLRAHLVDVDDVLAADGVVADVAVDQCVQLQFPNDFGGFHRRGQVVLVEEDEERHAAERGLGQQTLHLLLRQGEQLWIVGIHHEHNHLHTATV